MPSRRTNPCRVKIHRSYSVQELAACCGVHKNTVRNWQRQGLEPIDGNRPALFQGNSVRSFLSVRNASRKSPCPPGTFYCFRCREPRPPAHGMIDYLPIRSHSGNLRAICNSCETLMHRRVRKSELGDVMPGCAIQFEEGHSGLSGRTGPTLNCDNERR